jgi:signal transduction histidine kinase
VESEEVTSGALLALHQVLDHEREGRAAAEAECANLRAILMQSPNPVCIQHGPELVYTFVNPPYQTLMGRHRQLLGKPLREALPELAGQGVFELAERIYASGQHVVTPEFPARIDRSGNGHLEEGVYRIVWQPLIDSEGRINGVAQFGYDITEQVLARRRVALLSEATHRLFASLHAEENLDALARLMVEELAEACVIDLIEQGRPLGPYAVAHRDRGEEDALRARFHDAGPLRMRALSEGRPQVPDETPAHQQLTAALGCSGFVSVPVALLDRRFGVLTVGRVRPFTREEVALLEEVGARTAIALDHARLYREARDAIRSRDEFLSVASHELKTPLTPLQLRLAQLRREPDHPRAAQILEVAESQVKKLSVLVDGLLDVSRIGEGRLSLSLEQVDLAEVVRETAQAMASQAVRAGTPLEVHADQPLVGQFDRMRVGQVLTNLLSNAFKFGSGRPIEVEAHALPGLAQLSVSDQGLGIPLELREKIFDRYARGVSDRHYGGLGLGLWVSRQIAEAMGGTVKVESELGRGSRFVVELPLAGATE